MKSIEITSDSYAGVPADKEALTSTDIDAVFNSGDWKGASAALVSCIKGYVAQAAADVVTITEEIAKQAAYFRKMEKIEQSRRKSSIMSGF